MMRTLAASILATTWLWETGQEYVLPLTGNDRCGTKNHRLTAVTDTNPCVYEATAAASIQERRFDSSGQDALTGRLQRHDCHTLFYRTVSQ